jgi:hypothetical protein
MTRLASGKCDEKVNKVGRMKKEAVVTYLTYYTDIQLGSCENNMKASSMIFSTPAATRKNLTQNFKQNGRMIS